MRKDINKHGLKRYIPSDVRQKIRQESGFGCVMCGCVLTDYEHIEPEWNDAKIHDPEKMTLLCVDCHARVTRKLISKKQVWAAKQNPKSLISGFVHDLLYIDTNNLEVHIGNSVSRNTRTILTIYGKPIIWFEQPTLKDEPSRLCAILYDDKNNQICFINRNQIVIKTNVKDIKSESTELLVTFESGNELLFDREGDQSIKIKKLNSSYLNSSVRLTKEQSLEIKSGNSSMIFGSFTVENCGAAIGIGSPPSFNRYNKVFISLKIARHGKLITDFGSTNKCWLIGDELINTRYSNVGLNRNNCIYSVTNEFIGNIDGSHITYHDDQYENGEPIYITKQSFSGLCVSRKRVFDLSFRILDNVI